MQTKLTYCEFVKNLSPDNVHRIYHDHHYGFPVETDEELFERLILEINQAGLSWTTILNKQKNFREAYFNYNIKKIANLTPSQKNELLSNPGIIRNKLKIDAAVFNAQQILEIQKNYGSFAIWLKNNKHLTKEEWIKLFKKTFKFTGPEIVKEFLMSLGYLEGAHSPMCPIYKKCKTNLLP